ncbi:sirohydrochlorin chelatase [Streptomyces violaceoruber]|uniref:Sirohydrochlorin cobaltochelatase n=6 Tax=Streptomyces TaxID=1883 RepID=A0A7U9HAB8_STRLI|nr:MULTISPECIES: sirohydrochlorin chelatase [Streptomyces]QSJ12186.1 metal binding protein [Streptomyces lividans]AIJ16593.1 metal binding protein [Streptomyces lividans TK24]EFD70049.1 metal binding protein [Streptomyces lividans TK24]EOY46884.1 Sirohydrochlorin cobaltochelatase [Streptomyces lividans 1326]KKD10523.1 cobalamin biosynthesis protein CbiX [Streptomyces sp. WM6391]
MTTPPALLIAGHGTRDEAGAEAFRDFVRELGRRHPELPVAGGFIELSPPPLGDAVAELVERGVRRFAAVPLMLVSAGHAKGDIPAALAREKERHPGITYTYGRPLGPHPGLLRVLERRLAEAVDPAWDPAEVTVLLVGRGSTDPDANAEVFKAARLLWEGRGYAGVETAFVSLAEPDVPGGLERCVRLGARRVVVLPYFLFTGILPDRVRHQTEEWAAAHPETEVRSADVIGPEPELLDLVWERYEEAVGGDLRMNCDSCVYRIALPGFEDKVGLPQQPHFHPDDDGDHPHGHHHGHGHAHSHAH